MFKLRNKALWSQWVPLPLRLVIGFGFMAHGWAKLSRGPSGFAKLLAQIGAPLPEATAWVSTFIEIYSGLAIFLGAFVELVSVPLIVMMFVAMFTVHLRYGFSSINTIGLTEDGPNFGPPGRGPELAPGMVFAIEPMINAGGPEVVMHDDHWSISTADGSLSAHFEHTVAITEEGPRILTEGRVAAPLLP